MEKEILRPQYQIYANILLCLAGVYWLLVFWGPIDSLGTVIVGGRSNFIEIVQWFVLNMLNIAISLKPAIHCAELSRFASFSEMRKHKARERRKNK